MGNMHKKIRTSIIAALTASTLLVSQPAFASTINVNSGELNFGAGSGTIQSTDIGVDVPQGFSYRYDDVFSGVDAVATLVNVTNINSGPNTDTVPDGLVDFLDERSTTSGKSMNVDIDIFGASGALQSGSVTIRIDFMAADTNDAVTLENVAMLVKDIDSRQYATFAGISKYELSSSPATELTVSSSGGAFEFKEPAGASSESSHEENWVSVDYTRANSITIVLGARESGGAFFGVSFVNATWVAPPTSVTPSLTDYSLTYDTNSASSGSAPTTQNSTTSSANVTLSAPQGSLLKTNCTFGGWNTRADGTGANYQNAGTITLTANTTLFARWHCLTPYSLTYDSNSATSGSVPTTQNSTTVSSTVTLAAPQGTLVRTNCTFGGWNTLATGLGTNYLDAGSIALSANTTLYAKWSCTTPSSTPTPTPTSSTPAAAPASTTPVVATPAPARLLATTGSDSTGAWIVTGIVTGAGAVLLGVRRAMRKKIG
jgi:hypothetical protein